MEIKDLHYEFTGETIEYCFRTLHRIRATKDLPIRCVKAGDLGGWIEKEENLQGGAWVFDEAKVFDNAVVYGHASIHNNAMVYQDAKVYGDAAIFNDSVIFGNAEVFGNAKVYHHTVIYENAKIESNNDFCSFINFGSKNRTTIFFKTKDKDVFVSCDCFIGNLKEFVKQVKRTHKGNKYEKEYLTMVELVKIKFNL